MRTAVCILTYNRKDLFLRCLSSLANSGAAHDLILVDAGSTDGTAEIVAGMGGILESQPNTVGNCMNIAIQAGLDTGAELIIFSADDYEYRPEWLVNLHDFWQHAPADVAMATCHLEPAWAWNGVTEAGNAGRQRYAIRETVPGSNWTFRRETSGLILPIDNATGGEDLAVCNRLKAAGLKLAALDLAIHTGEQCSIWGNESWRYARPFDYELHGFERLES